MAVDTPIPSASEATEKRVKTGAIHKRRSASRNSRRTCSIRGAYTRARYNSQHRHAEIPDGPDAGRRRDRCLLHRLLGHVTPRPVDAHPEARHPRLRRDGPAAAEEMDGRRQAAEHLEAREGGRHVPAADAAL